jgi:hypothetical protein
VKRLDLGDNGANYKTCFLTSFCMSHARGHLYHVNLEQMLKVIVGRSDFH